MYRKALPLLLALLLCGGCAAGQTPQEKEAREERTDGLSKESAVVEPLFSVDNNTVTTKILIRRNL